MVSCYPSFYYEHRLLTLKDHQRPLIAEGSDVLCLRFGTDLYLHSMDEKATLEEFD
jgi:hypothetical protein